MDIVDKFNNGQQGVIYTVALEPEYMVDVAVSYETGLIYTMQNEDGSTVYGSSGHEDTYPEYKYDEKRVIELVNEVEKYIFEDELMVDNHVESVDGYLWATDNLVERLCQQKEPELDMDIIDDINFYAIYHVKNQSIEIVGSYWVCFDETDKEEHKEFNLALSPEESEILMLAMNTYCKQRYRKNCLEYVNDIRAVMNLPLLNISSNSKSSLDTQIQNASSKSDIFDSSSFIPIDQNR